MFEATYQLKSLGKFQTFVEAFKVIYDTINDAIKLNEPLSWQVLETTTWIESDSDNAISPIMFYEARDKMCREGYLVNGKWVNK